MPLLRPRDADALRAEMRHVASVAGVPIMFGGEVHDDTLLLTEFLGTRTAGLRGLAVRPSAGLGGATVVARRPMSVADYRRASTITHDYDAPVLGEGIRSILAVPVVVGGQARAVLYGAYRTAAPVGDRTADVMVASARRLSHELTVRDEVDRRLRLREAQLANFGGGVANTEKLREVHAELRRLAADTSATPAVRGQLRDLAERLAGAMSPDAPTIVFAADLPGSRRALPGGAWLHQCRSGATSFAAPRDGEKLSAQRSGKARHSHPPRGGVGGAAVAAAAVGCVEFDEMAGSTRTSAPVCRFGRKEAQGKVRPGSPPRRGAAPRIVRRFGR